MSSGETQPGGGAGELEDDEGIGVTGTAKYEADNEVLLGWNEDLPLCLQIILLKQELTSSINHKFYRLNGIRAVVLITGANLSQVRATSVNGRMQRVVHMIKVNREQNTRLTCTIIWFTICIE